MRCGLRGSLLRSAVVGAALGLAAPLFSCTDAPADDARPVVSEPQVEVVRVERKRHDVAVPVSGTIESRHDAVVAAEVSGRVVGRPVAEGARVKSGEVVVALEETAHRLERDLARVAAEEAALHADVPASERAVAELRLELAQDRLERCRIVAPMDATVEKIHVEVGEWVAPGMPVARLIDYEALRLVVHVGEDVAVRIEPGSRVTFTVDAHGPVELVATVARIARAADEVTAKFEVELHVEETPLPLFSGMFARAEIPVRGEEMIRLPKKAIRRRYGESYCFALEGEEGAWAARERVLRVAPIAGDLTHAEVLAGLEPGDRVIKGPFTGIRDGVRVRVDESQW